MKAEIVTRIKSTKCDNCSIHINDCKRRLDEKILCELRNNLTPQLFYWLVPETFDELKILVEKLLHYHVRNIEVNISEDRIEFPLNENITFWKDGTIKDCCTDNIAVNRTPAQMWQIIKSLMEE